MKYIRTYDSYKSLKKINEEFVFSSLKNVLGRLFQAFMTPFKDLVSDIEKGFKGDDPNSIKSIVMTNLNQAIDGAQKMIRDKSTTDVDGIVDKFITSLTELANGIDKDVSKAIDDKGKASGVTSVAKAILIGDEDAGWGGIIGLLSSDTYKYGKVKYRADLAKITDIKKKQDYANKFFDDFQKDITAQLDRELSDEELKKIYNDSVKKGGGVVSEYDYEKLLDFKNKKIEVKYKLKGYDNTKKPEDQPNQIGKKTIEDVDKEREVVLFIGKNNLKIEKKYSDILGPTKPEEAAEENKEVNKEVTDNLKKLSEKDPKSIELMAKVTGAIEKDPEIAKKIEDILPKEAGIETGPEEA